jgi:hypothetical protein
MSGNKMIGRTQNTFPVEKDLSAAEVFQSVDTFQQRGFPAPAFAYNAKHFTLAQAERNVSDAFEILLTRVIEGYVVNLEDD